MGAKAYLREAWGDMRAAARGARAEARRLRWALAAIAAAGVVVALLLAVVDHEFMRWIEAGRPAALRKAATLLRRWGDFRDTATITALVYGAGVLRRRRDWRRAAAACFAAACLAGLAANVVRFSAGRPRPRTGALDVWHGPTLDYKMQSFPSGHSTTSTAFGLSLALALPPAGLPALASAGGVMWACLYTRTHYPSDVAAGAAIGILVALPMGLAGRRLARSPAPAG